MKVIHLPAVETEIRVKLPFSKVKVHLTSCQHKPEWKESNFVHLLHELIKKKGG